MVDNVINPTENPTEEKELNKGTGTENKAHTGSAEEMVEPIVDENVQKLNELQTKFDELNERYIRLFSEFDNFRRRTIKEKGDLLRSAGEDVLKEMLPVWDDFDRAQKAMHTSENITSAKEGFDLIYNKFTEALKKKGIEEMKCIGTDFNADLHEAITEVPASSEDMKGKIVDVIEKGYYIHGKILKYAKVVVGK